jgi:hypothetical protein
LTAFPSLVASCQDETDTIMEESLEPRRKGESFEERLRRYVDRPAIDTLGWMTMYLQNEPAVELKRAREARLYYCVYLLAHSKKNIGATWPDQRDKAGA